MSAAVVLGPGAECWSDDDRFRFFVTIAGISWLISMTVQLVVLAASSSIRCALPFVLAGQASPLFFAAVIIVDIALLWVMFRLALRKGVRMMFVPVLFNLMVSALISGLAVMPICQVIALSQ